jgi:hypothetical protein
MSEDVYNYNRPTTRVFCVCGTWYLRLREKLRVCDNSVQRGISGYKREGGNYAGRGYMFCVPTP